MLWMETKTQNSPCRSLAYFKYQSFSLTWQLRSAPKRWRNVPTGTLSETAVDTSKVPVYAAAESW